MNAEHTLITELSDILGHNTKTAALFAEMEPAAPVVEEPQPEPEVEKIAAITDFQLNQLIEHPAFLAGVEEVFEKRAAELDNAMQAYVEKVAAKNPTIWGNEVMQRAMKNPGTAGSARAAGDAAAATRQARLDKVRAGRGGGSGGSGVGSSKLMSAVRRNPVLAGLGVAGGIGYLASRRQNG